MIAVTGASGAVGRRVAALLAEAGTGLRLVVRDAARAPDVTGADVRVAPGYGDRAAMRAALEGAATLFLVPAAESPDRADQHRAAVDAAADAGVERIVYLSFLGAAPDATFTLARDHWATEEHVRATGLPFVFCRMGLYMDFVPAMVQPGGVLRGPAGDGRFAPILRDDVAGACAAVLHEPGAHDGRTYELTGREALTFAETAATLARLTGRDIRFEDETDEAAYASRAGYGAPDWEVRGWVTSYQAIRDGSLDVVTSDVRELTGREPATLEAWLRAHPEALDLTP